MVPLRRVFSFCCCWNLILGLEIEDLHWAAEINGKVFRAEFNDFSLAGIKFADWLNVELVPVGGKREWTAA